MIFPISASSVIVQATLCGPVFETRQKLTIRGKRGNPGNCDTGGPQEPPLEEEPLLVHRGYAVRLCTVHEGDRLVPVWIEALALGRNALDPVPFKGALEIRGHVVQALEEGRKSFGARVSDMRQSPLQVVEDWKEILDQRLGSKLEEVSVAALGALAEVVELGALVEKLFL
jgi:hypothetical protein